MRRIVAVLIVVALGLGLAATASADPEPPIGATGPAGTPAAGTEAALTNVASVATGYYNGCALLTNRQVRCWGWNGSGGVGNGSPSTQFNTAQTVRNVADNGPLQNVRQVTVGAYHGCALLTNGQVRCWGYNGYGQLGNNNLGTDSLIPVVVRNAADTGPLQNVIQVSAEAYGTCALLASRQVRCWGRDDTGQLGDGSPSANAALPVVVKGVTSGALTDVASLGGGYGTHCAVLVNGQARCWGFNGAGGLGDGSTTLRPRPVVVRGIGGGAALGGVTQISTRAFHACARLATGNAVCWGGNADGNLGDGSTTDRPFPTYVKRNGARVTGIRSIYAGYEHTCALANGGGVFCWGDDTYAQNGDGTLESPTFRKVPNPVRNVAGTGSLTGIAQLAVADYHACARTGSGQVRCWGYGEYGSLGDGDTDDDVLPRPVLI